MTHQTTPSRCCLGDVADNAHQRRIRCEDRKILKLIKHTLIQPEWNSGRFQSIRSRFTSSGNLEMNQNEPY